MTPIFAAVNRVRERCPVFGGRVEYARSLSNLDYTNIPKCYIQYGEDIVAQRNETMDVVTQMLYRRVDVLILSPYPVSEENDPLRDAREEVRVALLGWQINPSVSSMPMAYVRGDPLEAKDAGITWRDQWEFTELLRSTRQE